ncbi:MAG: M28 family peptidase [Flavobacteriales bacterium]|nr:M28 family peptidase [Flavobacteriales bacterium]
MMKHMLVAGLLACACLGQAQKDSVAMQYAATITKADLQKHLKIIASDEFEGRETGELGQKKAAKYIADYFRSLEIPPSIDRGYYQVYPLKKESSLESKLMVGDQTFNFVDDFFFWLGFSGGDYSSDQIVFVGYGIDHENYSDYNALKNQDLTGKVVMLLDGDPYDSDGNSLITGKSKMSDWGNDWRKKREVAQSKGAKAVMIVKPNYKAQVGRVKYFLENPGLTLDYPEKRGDAVIPAAFIAPEVADAVFAAGKFKSLEKIKKTIKKKGKSVTREMDVTVNLKVVRDAEEVKAENVLAFIEGTDPELKEEVVVITAHYDHVGVNKEGEVFNGADDDGSGTVTALELAEAFQKAKKEGNGTRRSILIMTVSGEEKGLLGSEWYSEFPIYPLENTVANLNIDMIGRTDKDHEDPNYIYLIGSDKLSTELHAISEEANSVYTGLELDYTYNHPDDPNRFYYRSDHYNFARKGIPVIFYFSGVHEDYHKPGDDEEKIMYDKMVTIGHLIFHTAWQLANQDKRIEVDVENEFTD